MTAETIIALDPATYICGHPIKKTRFGEWLHCFFCPGIWANNRPAVSDEQMPDCAEGCGCKWDPSSPDYWRKQSEVVLNSPRA